nr:MAG TPA: hypothetical protein [Caudoviricetes sp.]
MIPRIAGIVFTSSVPAIASLRVVRIKKLDVIKDLSASLFKTPWLPQDKKDYTDDDKV